MTVLLVSLLRPILWLIGIYIAVTYKNWFAVVGSALCALSSIPIALKLSDYHVPHWLFQVSSLISTPAVMFIIAAMYWSAKNYQSMRHFFEEEVPSFSKKK